MRLAAVRPPSPALPLLLAAALLLGACEETVNPFLETDQNFTLFGTLDMAQDTQFVRVIPVRQVPLPNEPARLDVTFTSEDLTTGETHRWRDSLLRFPGGSAGHVFYAPLRIRPGHTYHLKVASPALDVVTSATTTAPPLVSPNVLPENVPDAGTTLSPGQQRVVWRGVPREPFRVEHWYRFLVDERLPFVDVQLPYAPPYVLEGENLVVDLDLRRDRLTLDTLVTVDQAALAGVGMRVVLLDAAFEPPGGAFDLEVLAQPGTLSNVENGFGFVGVVARYSAEWVLAPVSMERLRYRSLEDVFGSGLRPPGPPPSDLMDR